MSYPRYQLSRQFKQFTRTSGDLTLTGVTVWTNVLTASDLTLDCQVGDVIELAINAIASNSTQDWYLDVVTLVGGLPVNTCSRPSTAATTSPAPYGVPGWRFSAQSIPIGLSGYIRYTIVSGDLDTNNRVTFRLRYANSAATGSTTLYAGINYPFHFMVSNLGPSDDD